MASGNDDRQHTPTATAAHTARYDLQAGMAAGIMARRLLNGMQSGRQHIRVSFRTDGGHIRPTRRRVPGGGGRHPVTMTANIHQRRT